MKTGLTSVTFRQKTMEEVVALASLGGLCAIEWGGDIHCPPGQLQRARVAREATEKAGLTVSSYGSYYPLGQDPSGKAFNPVLQTALVLEAPVIRIWAGSQPSRLVSPDQRQTLAKEARTLCDLAGEKGIVVGFEYHHGSLTDEAESALRLVEDIDRPNCKLYWQEDYTLPFQENVRAVQLLQNHIIRMHVFAWDASGVRMPLQEKRTQWTAYLDNWQTSQGLCLLEFVQNDDPTVFLADCKILQGWVNGNESDPIV